MDQKVFQRTLGCDNARGDYFSCLREKDNRLVPNKEVCQDNRRDWIDLCPVEFRKEDLVDHYINFALKFQEEKFKKTEKNQ